MAASTRSGSGRVTNLEYARVPFLQRILREEVLEEWTELSCHPGYRSPDYEAVYLAEREEEVRRSATPYPDDDQGARAAPGQHAELAGN
jgi:hypothetical protein